MNESDEWLVKHDVELILAFWDRMKRTTVGFTHEDNVEILLQWMELRLVKEGGE